MANALIGYSGFVGSNLLRQAPFEGRFNTQNVQGIAGQTYDLMVVAGAPADKFKANRDPEADGEIIGRLTAALEQVNAAQVVLISTVEVYPEPVEVDEGTEIDAEKATPFGRHRFGLEVFLTARFNTLVVRLPMVYGPGLKKNVLFDLMNDRNLEAVHAGGAYQFYGLDRLWSDVQAALAARLRLVNLVTEPVTVREVAKEALGMTFENQPKEIIPARYDVRSRFAEQLGGEGEYLADKVSVLAGIAAFAQAQRQGAR